MTLQQCFAPRARWWVCAPLLLAGTPVWAVSGGIAGTSGATAGSDCTNAGCHIVQVPPVAVPQVAVTVPNSATPGSVNSIAVSITGGPAVASGIDVAASDGTLSVPAGATDIKLLNGEIVHAAPKPITTGAVDYTFDWTAPATNGTYTLYVAGMSSDGTLQQGDGTTLATATITVGGAANQPPVAVISGPSTGVAGATLSFDGSNSSDPDGTIGNYAWDFGNGSAGAGAIVTNVFQAGNYTVRLTVTDNLGATNTASSTITIATPGNLPPIANAGGPYNAIVGVPLTVSGAASSDPDGTITSYLWDFGNGITHAAATAEHTYTAAGTYSATLTVTDNSGLTATQQVTIVVTAPTPPGTPPGTPPVTPPGTPPVTPPAPPPPGSGTDGAALYATSCLSCHGPDGVGGPDGDVAGESAKDIAEAIEEVPEMASLATLTEENIEAIAAFLNPEEEEDDDEAVEADALADADSNTANQTGNPSPTMSSANNAVKTAQGAGSIDWSALLAGVGLIYLRTTWRRKSRV